jgi:hypothetical protein
LILEFVLAKAWFDAIRRSGSADDAGPSFGNPAVDVASRQPIMIGVVCTFTIPREIESKKHAVLPVSHKINGLVLVYGKRKGEL